MTSLEARRTGERRTVVVGLVCVLGKEYMVYVIRETFSGAGEGGGLLDSTEL